MRIQSIALAAGFIALCANTRDAKGQEAQLPVGISNVRIGVVMRGQGASGRTCSIPQSLPEPRRFHAGTREIGYTVSVSQNLVSRVDVELVGPFSGGLQGTGCDAYAVALGQLRRTQMGSSVRLATGEPFPRGRYGLRLTVDGRTVEIPFFVGDSGDPAARASADTAPQTNNIPVLRQRVHLGQKPVVVKAPPDGYHLSYPGIESQMLETGNHQNLSVTIERGSGAAADFVRLEILYRLPGLSDSIGTVPAYTIGFGPPSTGRQLRLHFQFYFHSEDELVCILQAVSRRVRKPLSRPDSLSLLLRLVRRPPSGSDSGIAIVSNELLLAKPISYDGTDKPPEVAARDC